MAPHGTSPTSVGSFRMVDIGDKAITQRRAVASGSFSASRETIARVRDRTLPKGDALMLAEIAGIQGAKRTSDLLPLCHPLSMTSVRIWTEAGTDQIRVFCEAKTNGSTGVEMEALCGVSAALLCIYDLTKGIDPVLEIGDIRLDSKEGGKSGNWLNPGLSATVSSEASAFEKSEVFEKSEAFEKVEVAVISVSDRCSRGERTDHSGPAAANWFKERGANVRTTILLPDEMDAIASALSRLLDDSAPAIIVTCGGTGLAKRDVTPDSVLQLAHARGGREVAGFGELMRQSGSKHTPMAWLSRSLAVLFDRTLVICLPGKPSAVTEGLGSVEGLLLHALHVASGGGHG